MRLIVPGEGVSSKILPLSNPLFAAESDYRVMPDSAETLCGLAVGRAAVAHCVQGEFELPQ